MNVLVACEESQRVCLAFRAKGHNAFSCDILPCSGGYPEYHIQGDCIPLLDGCCMFTTCDGIVHSIESNWDFVIAFPPCTYLSNAGKCNFTRKNTTCEYRLKRLKKMVDAVEFVNRLWFCSADKIVIENPIGSLSTYFLKPTQIIHPYEFGESVNKATCLWLKNLPLLQSTNIVSKDKIVTWGNGRKISKWYRETLKESNGDFSILSKIRSQTFYGIAKAMAEQWG